VLRNYSLSSLAALFVVVLLAGCTSEAEERLLQGKALYAKNCKVCHAQGINGAPILGNKKMWKPRAGQGLETLVEHASEGFGLMPAKGGNEALTKDEVRSVVEFMLSQLKDE